MGIPANVMTSVGASDIVNPRSEFCIPLVSHGQGCGAKLYVFLPIFFCRDELHAYILPECPVMGYSTACPIEYLDGVYQG